MTHSWETSSAAAPAGAGAPLAAGAHDRWRSRWRVQTLLARLPRPELIGLIALAAVLNLWALSRNGWANEYYSAAVRSMSSSWHNFLFASLDPSGVMTVDKPPLALWVQALSVRIFGYHLLSVLMPQALMGVASVVLLYDLVRRRFGRLGGFIAGLALALTPMTVAVSRHNNPDALLVLCCVAALWCVVRGLEQGRTRWLVAAGVLVGLGFETKMGVALAVVPGIVAAWLWVAPACRGRLHALRQLLGGGVAMVLVGGAWPALIVLTPAAERPWIAGTSDNSIFSLIFGYNGLSRVDGQTGSAGAPPGTGAGGAFGSSAGPLRLLNAALGGQAGWLLGFALCAGLAILLSSRLRRDDVRSGWLLAVGGAFLTSAVLFSAANGIFHPYYVALLAPFVAALVGAGVTELIGGTLKARLIGPLAVLVGVAVELVVRSRYPGQLTWLVPVLLVLGVTAAALLAACRARVLRMGALGVAVGVLLVAPGVWAFDTLGYTTSGTFPAGGPASAAAASGAGGGAGPMRRLGAPGGVRPLGASAPGGAVGGPPPGFLAAGGPPRGSTPSAPGGGFAGPGGGLGGPFGGGEGALNPVLSYVAAHGGGTVAVASQSSASSAIVTRGARVAGIGGFSGRESSVSVAWLAHEVATGKIRWVLGEQSAVGGGLSGRLPGDTRTGSRKAMSAVVKTCTKIALSSSSGSASGTLYDCAGHAAALTSAG